MHADPAINLPEAVDLWPDSKTPRTSEADGDLPRLTYYLPSAEYRSGQSILVLPGGGYGMVSSAKEGHRPAQWLAAHGIAAGVLEYRHAPQRYPVPLLDAQRGLRHLRALAERHEGLDPRKAGCLGFSAGGHLAGLLATQAAYAESAVGDALDPISVRPDFAIFVYPVVSFTESFSHGGSRDNLLGPEAGPDWMEQLSVEKAVGPDTPPSFITHAQGDPAVPVENALELYRALTRHGVNATLFLYEGESHGIGMAANHPWTGRLLDWLR